MDVDVLEGRVAVKSSFRPAGMLLARQTVMVGPGQKTEVTEGDIPTPPRRLLEADWRKLEELYQIGRKPQVILLLKNTPDRVRQLLAPCPIYISDNEPRELPRELEEAVKSIGEAINTGETARHIQAIKLLEKMAKDHPHAKYNAQLSLYLGSYYEFLGRHEEAIRTFKDVVARYPESQFAGMAQCAIGIIYEDKLSDPVRAGEVFRAVLKYYPDSLEALWVEEKLSEKKTI
jgi:tetratricopeptide (TPR) repeat protein